MHSASIILCLLLSMTPAKNSRRTRDATLERSGVENSAALSCDQSEERIGGGQFGVFCLFDSEFSNKYL